MPSPTLGCLILGSDWDTYLGDQVSGRRVPVGRRRGGTFGVHRVGDGLQLVLVGAGQHGRRRRGRKESHRSLSCYGSLDNLGTLISFDFPYGLLRIHSIYTPHEDAQQGGVHNFSEYGYGVQQGSIMIY